MARLFTCDMAGRGRLRAVLATGQAGGGGGRGEHGTGEEVGGEERWVVSGSSGSMETPAAMAFHMVV